MPSDASARPNPASRPRAGKRPARSARSRAGTDPAGLDPRDAAAARLVHPDAPPVVDPLMEDVLRRSFAEAGAHEGTLWLVDDPGRCLVPVFNTGPNAARLVHRFRQPLQAGLVSMVYASEQPFLENAVYRNRKQSKRLDRLLGVRTWALIVVPLYFLGACRGVISCVQLKPARGRHPDPPGLEAAGLESVQRGAAIAGRLLEQRLWAQSHPFS